MPGGKDAQYAPPGRAIHASSAAVITAGAVIARLNDIRTVKTANRVHEPYQPSWSMTSVLIRATRSARSLRVAPRFQSGTMNSS
jgi:hypothetical protein